MFEIKNVKISLKLEELSLNTVLVNLKTSKIDFSEKSNYIVIRLKYIYIIFKPRNQQINHINVTKIPQIQKINHAITFFKKTIFPNLNINIKNIIVDNITSIYKVHHFLNLSEIIEKYRNIYNIKYNNEKFPGMFIKFDSGTLIIFYTGTVIAIGCKSENDLTFLFNKFNKIILE